MLTRARGAGAVLALALLVAGLGLLPGPDVAATPIDDQRAKVEEITNQLEDLEEKADILAEDYVVANATLEQVRADIADTEERIAAKSAETEALRAALAKLAVNAYMQSGNASSNPLFTTVVGATDGLQRDHLTSIALDSGAATTDQFDEALADLDDERTRLADQRDQAADEAANLAEAKVANDEQKAEYQQARAAAEAELGDLIKQEEERRARESYERLQREAAAQAAAEQAAAAQAATRQAAQSATANPQNRNNGAPAAAAAQNAAPRSPAAAAPAAAPNIAPPPPPAVPAASSRAGTAINAAMTQLGVPWVFAMAEPGVGFDCSGLTSWAWGKAGVSMPHQSAMQFNSLPHVPISAAEPGDLIFYYSPISHVGIYLGDGKLVHAPNSGSVVNVATVNWTKVVGVARPG